MFTDLRQLPDSTYPLQRISEAGGGLFPKPFNTALKAKITANATCGDEIEEFCRMADIYSPRYERDFRGHSNWQLITFTSQTTAAMRTLRLDGPRSESSDSERRRRNAFMVAKPVTRFRAAVRIRHHRYWFETGECLPLNKSFQCQTEKCSGDAALYARKRFFIADNINLRRMWQS